MPARNRAILLTAPGASAIAVVRLLGPAVAAFLQGHFSRSASPGRATHGQLRDGSTILDDPVVVLLADGAGADLNLHGGPWIVRSVLELAAREGFPVDPVADSFVPIEAVEGRTVLEREIHAHLPLATTELAVRALIAQLQAWRGLLASQARADGAISEPGPGPLGAVLADRSLWWLLHPPTIAIVGAANVGKSTLANQLFARQRVITADMPGTTRDWVGESANLDGLAITLVDTPGIRSTQDPIERQAIQRSGDKVRTADVVVLVLDASRPPEPEQSELLKAWPGAIRVLNKSDRPAGWDPGPLDALSTVATTGAGIDALRLRIRQRFGLPLDYDIHRPRWWTRRQQEILVQAQERPEVLAQILDDAR